jgi:regulator of replication initiation timing
MNRFAILIFATLLASCGGPPRDSTATTPSDSTDVNQVLYDQVMDIHDEVMPKMNDIEALKKKLKDQIAASPDLVVEERKKLERRIANLDSVGHMMWDWMHQFSPPADSLGAEVYREYMEGQMEKVKKVREAMLEIINSEGGRKQ